MARKDEDVFEKSFDYDDKAGKQVAVPDTQRKDPSQTADAAIFFVASGATYQEVADRFGYASAHVARLAVEKRLASQVSNEDKNAQRALAATRYERLYRSVAGRALDPRRPDHLVYNQRAQHLVDRIVALKGLQAPTQINVTPTAAEFGDVLAQVKLALGLGTDAAQEADIIDVYPIGMEDDEADPSA